jgi:hypothetical protein
MNTNSFSDEELMAYADGELEAERARQIEQACLSDTRIAARVEMFRASRRLLSDAFVSVLDEPVPESLLKSIQDLNDTATDALPAGKIRPKVRRRRPLFMPALAASFALTGAFTAGWLLHPAASLPGTTSALSASVAPLAQAVEIALEQTGSGEIAHGRINGTAVDILPLSTVAEGGSYCREFDVVQTGNSGNPTLRGIACRDQQHWVARVLASQPSATASENSYQTASGGVDLTQMLGHSTALSADQERDLIARGWSLH